MEADSRQWMVCRDCDHQRSIWDIGGSPACGKFSSYRVVKMTE